METIVETGYVKLLALDVGHLETTIIMEKNTNYKCDIEEFKEMYDNKKNVVIFIIHMSWDDDIKFSDYQRICDVIHPFDYVRDLVTKKNGIMIHRNDITNGELYDQDRVTYLQKK